MSLSKILVLFLVISFVMLCLVNSNLFALAQDETTFDNTASTEAVTSINDAILKSLVIISQVAVLGIVFNYFFFNRFLNKKRYSNSSNFLSESSEQNSYFYSKTLKRVSSIVLLCCISIVIFSTCIVLLQSYQLSQNLDLDIYSAFDIILNTSVGQVWVLRIVTSSVIITVMTIFYFVSKMRDKTNQSTYNHMNNVTSNKAHYFRNNKLNQMFLLVVMVLSSINLFSNSMVSHSNSLPSLSTLAVSMDWIHFMAVSIWIGGLFYLSLIFLKNFKPVDFGSKSNSANQVSEASPDVIRIHNVSISLMNFSFIVIIALSTIGISGLYLGYTHLQDLNSVFTTSYGQILVLKLGLAFPLIFIGRYNQLKIYKYTSWISSLVKDMGNNNIASDSLSKQFTENRSGLFRTLNRSIRIESLLAIAVLIVASFLSVTSPPSLEAINQNSFNIRTNNIGGSDNLLFLYLIIFLVVIIAVIGIVNFKKNQKQVKTIFAITDKNS